MRRSCRSGLFLGFDGHSPTLQATLSRSGSSIGWVSGIRRIETFGFPIGLALGDPLVAFLTDKPVGVPFRSPRFGGRDIDADPAGTGGAPDLNRLVGGGFG